jgi:hypothetical protein
MSVYTPLPPVWPEVSADVRRFRTRRVDQLHRAAASLGLRFRADGQASAVRYAMLHHYTYAVMAAVQANQPNEADDLIRRWRLADVEPGVELLPGHDIAVVASIACRRSDDERYESPLYLHVHPGKALVPTDPDAERWRAAGDMVAMAGLDGILSEVTGVVVTLQERGHRETTNSYALKALPGTVFVDSVIDPVRLGELVLHESAHTLLNDVLSAFAVELDPTARWYSPWKNTYRPAYGLLHAGFAFGVLQKYFEFHAYRCTEPSVYARVRAEIGAQQWDQARESVNLALAEVHDDRVASLLRDFVA